VATVLLQLVGPTCASAYTVAVRWTASEDRAIAGYRLYVLPAGGVERAPIDVPRPQRNASGHFEGLIGDLQVETTYTFALSAYSDNGTESERSNSYTIGYPQAAAVVDSDHDGLTDAEEDRNRDLRFDTGETNRLVADTDDDNVPDGLEHDFGSDPLDANSPSCGPLDFTAFRVTGHGTATVGYDAELDDLALATTPAGRQPTAIGVMYPRSGKGTLDEPLLVTRIRDHDAFRIDIDARSTGGKRYRLRYEGHGGVDRVTRRRLRRSLGDHFTGERYEPIGIDVAADLALMDPGAVFATIERMSMRGSFVMQQPQVCH
jgi:hypothetical protein